MKKVSRIIISVVLAVLTATLLSAQVFADSLPDYISEVKVFEGSYDSASKEGFTLLKGEDNKPVDLNQGSGATDIGANGNKAVYLGYKTTKNRGEAITDLALMNMKGGYDVAEYDALMKKQMHSQIIPFVENFQVTINEYRANYNSADKANKARAVYIHDILNKFKDDDCGGAGLGDLLLNTTVYELAKPQYDALSEKEKEKKTFYDVNNQVRDSLPEAEKNKHADILTIIAQSNGKAMLLIENLLTRAADTEEDTWIDRFSAITYEDLASSLDLAPTDANKQLAILFDDDANKILEIWDDFREELQKYSSAEKTIKAFDAKELNDRMDKIENTADTTDEDKIVENFDEAVEIADEIDAEKSAIETVTIYDTFSDIEYGNGSLLDFFMTPADEISDDITVLYPLVASLTDGQRAGLDFVTLKQFAVIALTSDDSYSDAELDEIKDISIYDGVDRGIYKKGGVALTSDALRSDALKRESENTGSDSLFSGWTIAMMAVTGVVFSSFVASTVFTIKNWSWLRGHANLSSNIAKIKPLADAEQNAGVFGKYSQKTLDLYNKYRSGPKSGSYYQGYVTRTHMGAYMMIGLGIALIIFSALTVYLSYRDMVAQYKVDFTPIPHYMVDIDDITVTNESGDVIVIKNQSAYYKAVESNRGAKADYYDKIDTCADMNGCVNPQWLALYAARNDSQSPILASSLKVVVGSSTVPQGYKTGIHMFGEKAAFNLNSKEYCWNQKAKSVMVYYKVDDTVTTSTAGSNFTGGSLALAGVAGLAAGIIVTALVIKTTGKRKENKAGETA